MKTLEVPIGRRPKGYKGHHRKRRDINCPDCGLHVHAPDKTLRDWHAHTCKPARAAA